MTEPTPTPALAAQPLDSTSAAQQALVVQAIGHRLPHISAIAFGSRVAQWPFGNHPKPYSDLDVALFGLHASDAAALAHLRADLEESNLPWRVDLSAAQDLSAPLRQLVLTHGILIAGQAIGTAGLAAPCADSAHPQ